MTDPKTILEAPDAVAIELPEGFYITIHGPLTRTTDGVYDEPTRYGDPRLLRYIPHSNELEMIDDDPNATLTFDPDD